MNTTDLCQGFQVSKSTGSAKSKTVRDALEMFQMFPEWCLPSRLEKNLRAWMISVNGFMVDARHLSYDMQEIAFNKGSIPYIPNNE